jgi:hypothetical protein
LEGQGDSNVQDIESASAEGYGMRMAQGFGDGVGLVPIHRGFEKDTVVEILFESLEQLSAFAFGYFTPKGG